MEESWVRGGGEMGVGEKDQIQVHKLNLLQFKSGFQRAHSFAKLSGKNMTQQPSRRFIECITERTQWHLNRLNKNKREEQTCTDKHFSSICIRFIWISWIIRNRFGLKTCRWWHRLISQETAVFPALNIVSCQIIVNLSATVTDHKVCFHFNLCIRGISSLIWHQQRLCDKQLYKPKRAKG